MNKKKKALQKKQGIWRSFAIALIWIFLWSLAAHIVGKPLLLPGPFDTVKALYLLAGTMAFWQSTLFTMMRIMGGYLSAIVVGILLAMLCHAFEIVDQFFSPFRTIIRATPVTSFIILVLLWIRVNIVPAFISFLMVMPIIWTSVQEGLGQVDENLLEMADIFGLSKRQRIRHIYVPSILPYLMTSCATGLGFAWKSGIAAEVIARPAFSIGKNLQDAKIYLNTPDLFAWTLVVILLSIVLEKLLKRGIRRVNTRGMRKKA